jgi:hypothetical protein
MPRTTWRDLAVAPEPTAAATPGREVEVRPPTSPGDGLDSLQDHVPGLRSLLAERQRLQDSLDSLTGRGGGLSGDAERDTRRFPMFEAPGARRDADAPPLSPRERAEARAMDIDQSRAGRADPQERPRSRSMAERAERAAQAAAERVAEAAASWEQLREQQRQARYAARDAGRPQDLPLPAERRRAAPVQDPMQRLDQRIAQAGEALRSLEAGTRALSSLDLRRDSTQVLERVSRRAREQAEAALARTDVGRRLARLTDELPPPELRALPGEGLRSAEEILDARRLRALQSLRERREEQPETSRPARRGGDEVEAVSRPRR